MRPAAPRTCAKSAEAVAAGRLRRLFLAVALLPVLAACSLVRAPLPPPVPPTDVIPVDPAPVAGAAAAGRRLLELAERQLGAPYRWGGATPAGFDCSGLVRWVHGEAGITVPRTAAGQQIEARPVAARELLPGDLVFFRIDGRGVDHVGVYAGDGRFVHAPRSGRAVGYDRLDESWWAARYAGAGRFWEPAAP